MYHWDDSEPIGFNVIGKLHGPTHYWRNTLLEGIIAKEKTRVSVSQRCVTSQLSYELFTTR